MAEIISFYLILILAIPPIPHMTQFNFFSVLNLSSWFLQDSIYLGFWKFLFSSGSVATRLWLKIPISVAKNPHLSPPIFSPKNPHIIPTFFKNPHGLRKKSPHF